MRTLKNFAAPEPRNESDGRPQQAFEPRPKQQPPRELRPARSHFRELACRRSALRTTTGVEATLWSPDPGPKLSSAGAAAA